MGDLESSFAYCKKVTRRASSSFYLASRFFQPSVRKELYALYAFCRIADDIADAPGLSSQERRQELELLEYTLRNERYDESDLLWPAFFATLRAHQIPKKYFYDLLAGMKQDIEPFEIKDRAELEHYCYQVAGTVGAMCVFILSKPGKPILDAAIDLGVAMQITNIIRDVSADAVIGRVYLPTSMMRQYGVARKDVLAGVNSASSQAMLGALAKIANRKYDLVENAILKLPAASRRPVKIASALYHGILKRIEQKQFNVYNTRIRLSFMAKLMLVIKTR